MYEIVVFEEQGMDESSLQLHNRLAELAQENLQAAEAELMEVFSRNRKVVEELTEKHFSEEKKLLQEISKQIKAKYDEFQQIQVEKAKQQEQFQQRRAQQRESYEQAARNFFGDNFQGENRETRRMAGKEAKKLFRKISSKTHPDKVKNLRLNALFIDAKAAYGNDDVEALKQIWDSITSGRKTGHVKKMIEAVVQKRKQTEADLRIRKAKLDELKGDYASGYLEGKVPEREAVQRLRTEYAEAVQGMRGQLSQLEAMVEEARNPSPPVQFVTHFFRF